MQPKDAEIRAQLAEHQERIWQERSIVERCRRQNIAARISAEDAKLHHDLAMERAFELSFRLTELSHALEKRPNVANRQPALVRMIGRLDQAQAAACEILSLDAGQRLDTLAEVLGTLVEQMHDDVGELLHRTTV